MFDRKSSDFNLLTSDFFPYALFLYFKIEKLSIKNPKITLKRIWWVISAKPDPFSKTIRITSMK